MAVLEALSFSGVLGLHFEAPSIPAVVMALNPETSSLNHQSLTQKIPIPEPQTPKLKPSAQNLMPQAMNQKLALV